MEPRNYESGAAGSPPSAPASPSTGYPTGGDPQTATPATKPGAHWFYKIGESLRNVITNAGLTPDDGDLNLLQKAIVKLVSATNHVVRLEDVTFGPSVADGDAVYWDNANSRYDRAIADGTDKQKMVGFADVTNSLVEAFGRSVLFSGLIPGSKYYLSGSTAGAIVTTAPAGKVSVGLGKSATTLFVDIDPDGGVPSQDQSTWNTGTDTVESAISAEKLLTAVTAFLSNNSLTSSGYQVLPGGLIFQWGDASASSGANPTNLFPVAFPTSCVGVFPGSQPVTRIASSNQASWTPTSFEVTVYNTSGGKESATVRYFALGY